MKYDVRLTNANGKNILIVKRIRELLGYDMGDAMDLVQNAPCTILTDAEENVARDLCAALQAAGASVELIEISESVSSYIPPMYPANTSTATPSAAPVLQHANDRDTLVALWAAYDQHRKQISVADKNIQNIEHEISKCKGEIEGMKKEYDKYERIRKTGGNCMRPTIRQRSVFELPDASPVKTIFLATAISAFVILLLLCIVLPSVVEWLSALVNVNPAVLVWVGSPALAAIVVVLYFVIGTIKNMVDNRAYNARNVQSNRNYDTSKPLKEAEEFFKNIDAFNARRAEKNTELSVLMAQAEELENIKRTLPAVQNTLAMPNELRNAEGVALLIQYIDNGRADTIKESINLYYQDVKDAQRMAELKKQTQYVEQQMINSEIAAENTRIAALHAQEAVELAKQQVRAAERAADAAENASDYARRTYWDNVYERAKRK